MAARESICRSDYGAASCTGARLKKLAEWYTAAANAPGAVLFEADELERLEFAQLVLLGVPPDQIETMADFRKWDILEIWAANEKIRWGSFKK